MRHTNAYMSLAQMLFQSNFLSSYNLFFFYEKWRLHLSQTALAFMYHSELLDCVSLSETVEDCRLFMYGAIDLLLRCETARSECAK
jgi:hypothetical protein